VHAVTRRARYFKPQKRKSPKLAAFLELFKAETQGIRMVGGDILAQVRQNMRQKQAIGRTMVRFDMQGHDHGAIRSELMT
jgi:hypothetical protein